MLRKFLSPQLFQSEIKLGKVVGKGQQPNNASQPVRTAKIIDEGHIFKAVRKQLASFEDKQTRTDAIAAWRKLKKAKLPVPKFFRINLKKGQDHLAAYIENMRIGRGKLSETHEMGIPIGLRKLTAKHNELLIQSLAHDLGTIYSSGLHCPYLDFWHFYTTKNGRIDRVILDFESFRVQKHTREEKQFTIDSINNNLHEVRNNMSRTEYLIFIKELMKSKFFEENKDQIQLRGIPFQHPQPIYY